MAEYVYPLDQTVQPGLNVLFQDSMGRYSSRGYSRDDGTHKMRSDLEMKLANATDERERQMYMKWLRDLDN